jgi:uncharacterized protein
MNQTSKTLKPAIVVMAKIPQLGAVKTRLRPFLSAEKCVEVSTCFLHDSISNATQIVENVIVAYSPPELKNEVEKLVPANVILIEQCGNDLGERLFSAFQNAENLGFSPIIAIGTDSPSLPNQILQTAIDSFENAENDIVLGETTDGGYYLIGLRKANREIFADVAWSSETVYKETIGQADLLKLRNLTQLPIWYDVDFPADLVKLRNEILNNKVLQKRLSATAKWLTENDELFSLTNR